MSNIQIEIINVSSEVKPTKVAGKTYELFDVAYKNKSFQDKVEGKKIPAFASPAVSESLRTAKYGDKFTVVREKDGEFWKWVQLIPEGGAVPFEAEPQPIGTPMNKPATPSPKSTYETSEERAARQVMIVRQSSLANAVALLASNGGKKNTSHEVIEIAKEFEAFVMGKELSNNVFNNMDEDVL